MKPFAGQWAVVTGGSKGIGLAIARRLATGGANVVLVARDRAALEAAVGEVRVAADPEQEVVGKTADVADRQSIAALFDDLHTTLPHLNVFVANAGTGHITPFLELTAEEWDAVVALNLTGTAFVVQSAAKMMRESGTDPAVILVVSSIRANGTVPGRLVYSATKAALNQTVRAAARELAPYRIRVNAISPGITETPLTAVNPEAFAEASRQVPLGRPGQPDDMAAGAFFLCGPDASFITGVNLAVDGGESLVW